MELNNFIYFNSTVNRDVEQSYFD